MSNDELRPAKRPANGNGHDDEPCAHGSYEVKVDARSEPRRLICADCGEEWTVEAT